MYLPIAFNLDPAAWSLISLNENLDPLDTFNVANSTTDSMSFYRHMSSPLGLFIFIRKIHQGNIFVHAKKIGQSGLSDSLYLNLDTVSRWGLTRVYNIDSNTVRAIISKWDTSFRWILSSVIVDLDSNLQIKDYHAIRQDYPGVSFVPNMIWSVSELNDTLWHVHTEHGLYLYNPVTKRTLLGKDLWGVVHSYQIVSKSEYLALGIVGRLTIPGQPGSKEEALGFYRIGFDGTIKDTVAFSAVSDSSRWSGSGFMIYSREDSQLPNVLAEDTNNIFLASHSRYTKFLVDTSYFLVVKTNSVGDELWRYSWKASYGVTNLTGIVSTSDGGCIVVGLHAYEFPASLKGRVILIKLGPDGTISNVEFNAPETVVSFYPNPVKERLHYSVLEAGNGPYLLEVHDMQGKPVLEAQLSDEENHIPVNLNKGFYLYQLKSEIGKVEQVGKLVVE